MAIVKSMHMYLTYVSMRHTLANTAELSVELGTNYISDCGMHALHFLLLQTMSCAQPAEWQHPYSCDTVALLQ